MLKILILGGTKFIGRYITEQLIQRNDISITLFNRGYTNNSLFSHLTTIYGDRNTSDIQKVATQNWDVVIDTSCYFPHSMKILLQTLRGRMKRFIFISSIAVYRKELYENRLLNESCELLSCTPEQAVDKNGSYGERKSEIEKILLQNDWLDKIIIRPSIVFGKYDYSDRFYYWMYRVKTQNRLLLPNNGEETSNFTFAGDLARTVEMFLTANKHTVFYNIATHNVIPRKHLFFLMEEIIGRKVKYISVPGKFLLQHDIQPGAYSDIPLFYNGNFAMVDNSKLKRELGIQFTPLKEALKQTIAYFNSSNIWAEGKTGIRLHEEAKLINAFQSRLLTC